VDKDRLSLELALMGEEKTSFLFNWTIFYDFFGKKNVSLKDLSFSIFTFREYILEGQM